MSDNNSPNRTPEKKIGSSQAIWFVVIVVSGAVLTYLQMTESQELWPKLIALVFMVLGLYKATNTWAKDNPSGGPREL